MNKTTPNNRKDLLDELDNLRGLLGDANTDVSADNLPVLGDSVEDDGQLPLLQAEAPLQQPAPAATKAVATSKPQAVAESSKPTAPRDVLQQSLATRANPFLKNAEAAIAARDAAKAAAPITSKPATPDTVRSTPPLTEAQINRLVDDVLKECLPHIEQTLRIHLNAALHRQNRNN